MRSNRGLSTVFGELSTLSRDNLKVLTSTFTACPQKKVLPITTIFIYKYLPPQANLWVSRGEKSHSANPAFYAKLSNLEGVLSQTNEMRASA
jgi:hypothetical protein